MQLDFQTVTVTTQGVVLYFTNKQYLVLSLSGEILIPNIPYTNFSTTSHLFFLTFYSLGSNQISDEGARAVAEALQVNQSLQELK